MKKQSDLLASYISYTICSSCGKCTRNCPAQINIPEVLKIYGEYEAGNVKALTHLNKIESYGLPIDCIECGACSSCCPQGIKIRKIMRELAMIQASQTVNPHYIKNKG